MAKVKLFISMLLIIIIYATYVKCQCNSDLLRDYAVDACNHINKRSALHDIYDVEDLYARHHVMRHFKKLRNEDFPEGGYLRMRHSHYLKHQRLAKKISNEIYDNTSDGIEILTKDLKHDAYNHKYNLVYDENDGIPDEMERSELNHKSNDITYRSRRQASKEVPIDYCCSQSTRDICNRYMCH